MAIYRSDASGGVSKQLSAYDLTDKLHRLFALNNEHPVLIKEAVDGIERIIQENPSDKPKWEAGRAFIATKAASQQPAILKKIQEKWQEQIDDLTPKEREDYYNSYILEWREGDPDFKDSWFNGLSFELV